ncbi:MAG: lamin tail domain-containing protein, partial [Verrucomicrobiales bacterium]|nr:lamin tail domain-containing protein [Verrucomicrobiales bacterium]
TNGGSTIGLTWTGGTEPFDDSSWTLGTGGMGYDENTTYDTHIQIDLNAEMNDTNTSAYMRIPFTVAAADLAGVNWMQLSMKYDDGFVAYLNGVRIEDSNGLASPVWNSEGNGQNDDTAAVQFRGFNVTDYLGELRVGQNILAIHGLNDSLGSSDFLCSPQLEVGMRVGGGLSDTAIEATGAVTLNPPARIRARTLHNGQWSAMVDATFDAGSPTVPLRFTEVMYNPTGGNAYEFIELTNTGARPFDLSFATFDGIGYTFDPGTTIPAGTSFVLTSNDNPDAFASRYPGTVVYATFAGSLSNGGERIGLLDVNRAVLASVRYRDDRGWPTSADGDGHSIVLTDPSSDPSSPASWRASSAPGGSPGTSDPPKAPPALRISEILADATSSPDFIELHNTTTSSIDISGYAITDDPRLPYRFVIPTGTAVPAGGQLVLWCDTDTAAPGIHTGFALDSDGETLVLHSPAGAVADIITFGFQATGHSVSYDGDTWQLTQPSPGQPNTTPVPLAPQSALTLNEWLTDPLPGDDDWLELFNTDTSRPVALHGLHLSAGFKTHRYPSLAFLAPTSHRRLWADDLDLNLAAAGTTIALADTTGSTITSVNTVRRPEGVTAGRLPDGSATITAFPAAASPGTSNYTASNPGLALSEILTLPTAWIELHNTTGNTFDLSGFSLSISARSPAQWSFPQGTTLAPNARLTVSCDPTQPSSPTNIARSLKPRGTTLYLFDIAGRQIDTLAFGPQLPGLSIGKTGNAAWSLLSTPTPAAPNSTNATLATTGNLRINEWLADPADGSDDFVELYNPAAQPVALAGLHLTDDLSAYGLSSYALPDLSYIAAGGFLHYVADGNLSGGPAHLPFSLDADGETLRLTTAGFSLVDEVTWGIETSGLSSGRLPDGDASLTQLPTPTPGRSNATQPDSDSDSDNMPDAWEQANGLDPLDPGDAAADLDADGSSSLDEYRANTDPRDPASRFAITTTTSLPGGISVTFTARPGITYTLESTTDLKTWSRITSIPPVATTGSKTVTHNAPLTPTFIRITAGRTLE